MYFCDDTSFLLKDSLFNTPFVDSITEESENEEKNFLNFFLVRSSVTVSSPEESFYFSFLFGGGDGSVDDVSPRINSIAYSILTLLLLFQFCPLFILLILTFWTNFFPKLDRSRVLIVDRIPFGQRG